MSSACSRSSAPQRDARREREQREQLEDRRDHLREHEERHADEADRAVAAPEHHPPVRHDRLEDDALPPLALCDQLADGVRSFRHADRVGERDDLVRRPCAAEVLVHAERQLDVLAREGGGEAADLLDHVAPPDLERADRAEHRVQPRPAESVVEERAQVVAVLEHEQRPRVELRRLAVLRERLLGPAADRDVTGDADDPLRVDEREPHPVQEARARQDRVAVDAADVAVAGEVEAAVERVRLAAVHLVDHDQLRVRAAAIQAADRPGLVAAPVEVLDRLEVELALGARRACRRSSRR